MKISKRGLDELIKPHEGYLIKQPDGSCKAYRCPAGVLTAGWGCTSGVTANTHWTLFEAEAALQAEMHEHEANVLRLVKVPLNQCQFDALVSLCYNIGAGNLGSSSLLKHLNAGDYARAASHFADWKYAKVQGDTAIRMKVKPGTSVVLPGLVTRRGSEAAMFLETDLIDMPQKVEPPRTKFDVKSIIAKVAPPVAAGGAALGELAKSGIPPVPEVATKSLEHVGAWKQLGGGAWGIAREVLIIPWPFLLAAVAAGGVLAFLKLRERGNVQTR